MVNAQDLVTRAVTQLAQIYEGRSNLRQYWDFLNRNTGIYVGYRNGEFGFETELRKLHDEIDGNGIQVHLRHRYDKNRKRFDAPVELTRVEFDHVLNTTRLCLAYMLRTISQKDKQSQLIRFIEELDRNIQNQVITVNEGVSALENKVSSMYQQ